jgi:hypothetical protein
MRWSSTISIPRSGPLPDLIRSGPGRGTDTHEGCCGSFRIVVGCSCRNGLGFEVRVLPRQSRRAQDSGGSIGGLNTSSSGMGPV